MGCTHIILNNAAKVGRISETAKCFLKKNHKIRPAPPKHPHN